jgi:plasmid stability protein
MMTMTIQTRGDLAMTSITIPNLDEAIKQGLRIRAAERGNSMEEEARDTLPRAMAESPPPRDLTAAIHARVTAASRADLTLPLREAMREPPQFGRGR